MFGIKTASLALFTACLTILGCGRERARATDPEETFLPLTVLEGQEADIYPFADPQCQSEDAEAPTALSTTRLQLWRDGNLSDQTLNLESLSMSGAPLTAPHISQVTVNSVFERQCDATKASPPDCRDRRDHPAGWFVTEKGQPLKICTPTSTPPSLNT